MLSVLFILSQTVKIYFQMDETQKGEWFQPIFTLTDGQATVPVAIGLTDHAVWRHHITHMVTVVTVDSGVISLVEAADVTVSIFRDSGILTYSAYWSRRLKVTEQFYVAVQLTI